MLKNFNCWIRTTVTEVRIAADKQIYVKGKKRNGTFPEVRFVNTGLNFYTPQVNDTIIMWFPDDSIDIRYCYAVLFDNNLSGLYNNGEGKTGIIESFIEFFKAKLNFKAPEANFNDCSSIVFKNGGKEFLNKDAVLKVIIPSGSSAGTYSVIIESAGQNKVVG